MKLLLGVALMSGLLTASINLRAADKKDEKVKPYPLKTCLVSGEKLGEMGKTYTFTHEGQEIKLCCKDCLKDFKKDTAKYMKKLAKAEKK